MKVREFLESYYASKPFFGNGGGLNANRVKVYLGPFNLYIPNSEMRKQLIPYHDMHHIISGYNNSRIGEGEVAAWELASGCLNKPLAAFLNLTGVATGLCYSPTRVYAAFMRGRQSDNFYGMLQTDLLNAELDELRRRSEKSGKNSSLLIDNIVFALYASLAFALFFTFPAVYVFGKLLTSFHNNSVK